MIFSYLWTYDQATKRIKEINSKSKEVSQMALPEQFYKLFVQIEFAKPLPLYDVEFDDFGELDFSQYKDVHIHELDIFDDGEYLSGLELYYLVDGDVMKYVIHHRVNHLKNLLKNNPFAFLQTKKFINTQ